MFMPWDQVGNSSTKNENLLKIYLPSSHQRCRWLCFFIWTDWEKFSLTSLAHQFSEWVPSKYHFIIHNNASSSEKVYPLLSSHNKIHWYTCLELFSLVNGTWDEITFSLEKILWIEDFFTREQRFEVEQTHSFSLHKMLIDRLSCRSLVDICDVFISRMNSHSDGTHSLQRLQ